MITWFLQALWLYLAVFSSRLFYYGQIYPDFPYGHVSHGLSSMMTMEDMNNALRLVPLVHHICIVLIDIYIKGDHPAPSSHMAYTWLYFQMGYSPMARFFFFFCVGHAYNKMPLLMMMEDMNSLPRLVSMVYYIYIVLIRHGHHTVSNCLPCYSASDYWTYSLTHTIQQ